MHTAIIDALGPILVLLALAIVAAVGSKAGRTSPIVGYLLLGVALSVADLPLVRSTDAVTTLADLGVMFLLFDLGLHFPLPQIRERASDIFGFGSVQVLLGTTGLALVAWCSGIPITGALVLGAALSLSSTAVVARLIADRHQQGCPVGRTATAILIFQDVAGILLLVVVTALGGGAAVVPTIGLTLVKAGLAFGVTIALSRVVVRPMFDLAARSGAEEVFTAAALFFALGAGLASELVGLSLSLGAFLGGVALAESPYRHTIAAEVKPFRGLLLGFFFISVGASLDLHVLASGWPWVLLVAAGLIATKTLTNIAASLLFRWSVPGSIQLGFLLSQGSEFAFVLLTMPAVRILIGPDRSAVAIAAVALTLMATPLFADLGRRLAGEIRRKRSRMLDPELTPVATTPILIVGMGRRGRGLGDALSAFDITYAAVERDPQRLKEAIADGYPVVFGDMVDPRLWSAVASQERRMIILTSPSLEDVEVIGAYLAATHPGVRRIAALDDIHDADRFRSLGVEPIVDASVPPGFDLATHTLREMGIDAARIDFWRLRGGGRGVTPIDGILKVA